jgi:precorrin-6B methylase 2
MKEIKQIILKILNKMGLGAYVQLWSKSYLQEIGWFNSVQKRSSVDKIGNPLPWVTYPFIHFIEERISKEMIVFEYGSGSSTEWYSQKVAYVYSVEHDEEWQKNVSQKNIPNAEIVYQNNLTDAYHQQVLNYDFNFDIVIVDGRNRVKCLIEATKKIKDTGVIVLDNSERENYKEGIDFLLNQNFKKIDFWGMGPSIAHLTCTTIFYKNSNCLGI